MPIRGTTPTFFEFTQLNPNCVEPLEYFAQFSIPAPAKGNTRRISVSRWRECERRVRTDRSVPTEVQFRSCGSNARRKLWLKPLRPSKLVLFWERLQAEVYHHHIYKQLHDVISNSRDPCFLHVIDRGSSLIHRRTDPHWKVAGLIHNKSLAQPKS